jgi:hypothetical protein
MKQLFYIVGFIVLLFVAHRVMAKIKDVPEENFENFPEETDEELSEDSDIEDQQE